MKRALEPLILNDLNSKIVLLTGPHLENLVACALLKELQYIEDISGKTAALHYLRTKDGKEIDFLISIEETPTHIVEVKHSDETPSSHFSHFAKSLPDIKQIQLVKMLKREKTYPSGVEVRALISWLTHLDLNPKI